MFRHFKSIHSHSTHSNSIRSHSTHFHSTFSHSYFHAASNLGSLQHKVLTFLHSQIFQLIFLRYYPCLHHHHYTTHSLSQKIQNPKFFLGATNLNKKKYGHWGASPLVNTYFFLNGIARVPSYWSTHTSDLLVKNPDLKTVKDFVPPSSSKFMLS